MGESQLDETPDLASLDPEFEIIKPMTLKVVRAR
jgi:hypothetical protein